MIAAVVGPFNEAVRATTQPCTFLLIVPTLTAVVAARARWEVLAGAAGAAVVGGWVLVDNRWILEGAALRFSAVLVIILLAVMVAPAERVRWLPQMSTNAWSQAAMVGAITLLATMWWRPCVGRELGGILNQDSLSAQLLPMAAYMLGALLPAAAVVAIRYAARPPDSVLVPTTWAFALVGAVIALSLLAGQHDDVVVTLTRWTLE